MKANYIVTQIEIMTDMARDIDNTDFTPPPPHRHRKTYAGTPDHRQCQPCRNTPCRNEKPVRLLEKPPEPNTRPQRRETEEGAKHDLGKY